MQGKIIRVLIAKPNLDGHDRGAKVVSLALRDAGMEVIYSGLHQSIEEIVAIAMQEAVDVIGLSIMTGAHIAICTELMQLLREEELTDIHLVVGGVIPQNDVARLEEIGAKGVFPGGTRFDTIVDAIRALV